MEVFSVRERDHPKPAKIQADDRDVAIGGGLVAAHVFEVSKSGELLRHSQVGLGQLHLLPRKASRPLASKIQRLLSSWVWPSRTQVTVAPSRGDGGRFHLGLLPDFAAGLGGVFEHELIEPGALHLEGVRIALGEVAAETGC